MTAHGHDLVRPGRRAGRPLVRRLGGLADRSQRLLRRAVAAVLLVHSYPSVSRGSERSRPSAPATLANTPRPIDAERSPRPSPARHPAPLAPRLAGMGERSGARTLPVARPVTVRVQPGMRLLAALAHGRACSPGSPGASCWRCGRVTPERPSARTGGPAPSSSGGSSSPRSSSCLPCALLVILTLRTTLTTTRAESRLGWHRARVDAARGLAHVVLRAGPSRRDRPDRRAPHGARPDGSPVATFSQRETDWPLVLANLREWVRVRAGAGPRRARRPRCSPPSRGCDPPGGATRRPPRTGRTGRRSPGP